jgi:uncharacterized protein YrrD
VKKSFQIIGLPIICLMDGEEAGTVKDLVINAKSGRLAALLVLVNDGQRLSGKLLSFSAIVGFGDHAITIRKAADIIDINTAKELEQLLIENVKVIGTNVLSELGILKGQVVEIFINDDGTIAGCEVNGKDESVFCIPMQQILAFGEKVLVVSEEPNNSKTTASFSKITKSFQKVMRSLVN